MGSYVAWTALGAGLLLLGACGPVEEAAHSDRINSAIVKSQVAMRQAADDARTKYEAARQEEALEAIANAKGPDGYIEPAEQAPHPLTLGSRYEVREDARGYSVYDLTTGALASGEHGPLRGLDRDVADQAVVRLNGANDSSERVTFDGQ